MENFEVKKKEFDRIKREPEQELYKMKQAGQLASMVKLW